MHGEVRFFNSVKRFGFECILNCNVQDSVDAEGEVLLDPNLLSDDGTVALNTIAVSTDANYLAYGLSNSGSDWVTIKVMRVSDRKVEPDTLYWVSLIRNSSN